MVSTLSGSSSKDMLLSRTIERIEDTSSFDKRLSRTRNDAGGVAAFTLGQASDPFATVTFHVVVVVVVVIVVVVVVVVEVSVLLVVVVVLTTDTVSFGCVNGYTRGCESLGGRTTIDDFDDEEEVAAAAVSPDADTVTLSA